MMLGAIRLRAALTVMPVVVISISPHLEGADGGSVHRDKFEGRVGDRLLTVSRQPLLDCARVLASEGVDPATRLILRLRGSTTDAITTTVGSAAKLTVKERDARGPTFEGWKPSPYAPVAARTATKGSAGTGGQP